MINKNEAPEGYEAAKSDEICKGCAASNDVKKCLLFANQKSCIAEARIDGEDVIFVCKSTAPATLLHPMGSMGEEV